MKNVEMDDRTYGRLLKIHAIASESNPMISAMCGNDNDRILCAISYLAGWVSFTHEQINAVLTEQDG